MTESKMRWGILSTANIGRAAVIPAIKSSKNAEVVAVASRDRQKGIEFAGLMGIPKSYASYEALLDDPDIDAVYIPLPNSLHYEWAIKVAQAGKHVLCEKPLAISVAQCLEMDAAARESGVLLMEAFMYRFHPRTEMLIERVRAGALGPLQVIQSSFTFKLTRPDNIRYRADLGGGALMDVGSYCVNISLTLAGGEPEAVQAVAAWTGTGVDERLAGTLLFANGLIAQFDCALSMARRESIVAAGTNGYYYVPAAFLPGKEDVLLYEFWDRKETPHQISGCDQYQLMVEHFMECILSRKQPRYTVMDAAANMHVIEALYQSAHNNGKWQFIHPLT